MILLSCSDSPSGTFLDRILGRHLTLIDLTHVILNPRDYLPYQFYFLIHEPIF